MSNKSAFVQQMYQAGVDAGLSDAAARVMAAQAGIESAYGERAPGNNYFAITKGADWNGPTIARQDVDGKGNKVTQQFRSYDSPEAGLKDRISYMDAHFPGFSQAPDLQSALGALRTGKYGTYYTAPRAQYESAVNGINSKYLPAKAATTKSSAPATAIEAATTLASGGAPNIIDLTKGGAYGKYTIPADAYASTPRKGEIKGVVFHHTGGESLSGAIGAGQKGGAQPGTGSTYYIDKDGSIVRYAPDNMKRVGIRDATYRTDKGKPTSGMTNDNTISIEVVAPDSKHFTQAQRESAASLGKYLATTYKIDPSMIVGHGDIQGGSGGNKQPDEGVDLAKYVRDDIGGRIPPMNIPQVASELDVRQPSAPTPMPGRPAALTALGSTPPGSSHLMASLPSRAGFGVNDPGAAPLMTPGLKYVPGNGSGINQNDQLLSLAHPTEPFASEDHPNSNIPARVLGSTPTVAGRTLGSSFISEDHPTSNAVLPAAPTPMPSPSGLAPQAPTPMPGRPAALDAPAQPAPDQQPPALTVKLASGDKIAVGTYPSSDGHHQIQISDDGQGNAKITKLNNLGEIPGLIDPLREMDKPTVAGGVIRSIVPKAIDDGISSFAASSPNAIGAAGNKAYDAATNLAKNANSMPGVSPVTGYVGDQFNSAKDTFGKFIGLGGKTDAPEPGNGLAFLGNVTDRAGLRALGSPANVSGSPDERGSVARPAQVSAPQVRQAPPISRPAAAPVPMPGRPAALSVASSSHAPAATTSSSASSGGNNSGGGAAQTFQGSATGRTYTVGATYSNKGGDFVAQADGSFKKVA